MASRYVGHSLSRSLHTLGLTPSHITGTYRKGGLFRQRCACTSLVTPPPRPYQQELFQYAKDKNTLVYLDTGSGKTLVAVLLVKHKLTQLKAQGQVGVFLAPTIPLTIQQGEVFAYHGFRVGTYAGDMHLGTWDLERWQQEKSNNDVLVMTPDVLINCLAHGYLRLNRDIGLVIFDEVHHGRGDSPYACIMDEFYSIVPQGERPQVLGLTASPARAAHLEDMFHSQLVTAKDRNEVQEFVPISSVREEVYTEGIAEDVPAAAREEMGRVMELLVKGCQYELVAKRMFRRRMYEQLGDAVGDQDDELLGDNQEMRDAEEYLMDHLRPDEVDKLSKQMRAVQYCLNTLGAWPAAVAWTQDVLGLSERIVDDFTDQLGWMFGDLDTTDLGDETATATVTLGTSRLAIQEVLETLLWDFDHSLTEEYNRLFLNLTDLAGGMFDPAAGFGNVGLNGREHTTALLLFIIKVALLSVHRILVRLLVPSEEHQEVMIKAFYQVVQQNVMERTTGAWKDQHGSSLLAHVDVDVLDRSVFGQSVASDPQGGVNSYLVTSKVQQMVQQLMRQVSSYREDWGEVPAGNREVTPGWSSIIFVERKVGALVLSELINLLPTGKDCLKSAIFVGNTLGSGVLSMDHKRQRDLIHAFSAGDYNVLVATDVGSEGMDFRQCQYVVCFDLPRDATSWVQCRGRARQKLSDFVVMIKEEERMKVEKLKRNVEQMVEAASCLSDANRSGYAQEPAGSLSAPPAYAAPLYVPETGALMPWRLATVFLLQYVNQLPGTDRYTVLQPQYIHRKVDDGYRSQVILPNNAPIRERFGDFASKKNTAKRLAALRVLKELYDIGELDQYLCPRWRSEAEKMKTVLLRPGPPFTFVWSLRSALRYEGGHQTVATTGTGASVPPSICSPVMYAYGFAISKISGDVGTQGARGSGNGNSGPLTFFMEYPNANEDPAWHPFGMLLPQALPESPPFRVWLPDESQGVARLKLLGHVEVAPDEMNVMRANHQLLTRHLLIKKIEGTHLLHAWKDLHQLLEEMRKRAAGGHHDRSRTPPNHVGLPPEPLVIPINNSSWVSEGHSPLSLSDVLSWPMVDALARGPQPLSQVVRGAVTDRSALRGALSNTVMFTHYLQKVYHMDCVSDSLDVDSCMPEQDDGQELTMKTTHPLVTLAVLNSGPSAVSITSKMDVRKLLPGDLPPRTFRNYFRMKYGVEGLTAGQPMLKVRAGRGMLKESIVAPVVEKRSRAADPMHQDLDDPGDDAVYLVPELCSIFPLRRDKWNQLFVTPSLIYRVESVINALSFRDKVTPPGLSPELVPPLEFFLYCTTSRRCREPFNLERYEFLGDTVLKFLSSAYCYLKYPEAHEGDLTIRKVRSINNEALADVAEAQGLLGHLRVLPLEKQNYYVEDAFEPFKEVPTTIKRKTAADMVEAAIGIFYEAGGLHAACALCEHLAVLEKGTGELVLKEGAVASTSSKSQRYRYRETVEETLDYRFSTYPDLLPQALRHCSWPQGPCYQRLEFLGDAIVDLLVTEDMFRRHRDLNQGQLTEARAARVNNLHLAMSVVPLGLHQYLQVNSYALKQHMTDFTTHVSQKAQQRTDPEARDVLQEEFTEEGAPKVLADIVESLVAAVWLDSGRDMGQAKKVLLRLVQDDPGR